MGRIMLQDRYELICRWLLFVRWLERSCLFTALGLSLLPLVSTGRIAGVIPWLSMAAIATAFTADFIRSYLTIRADHYHERIENYYE